MLALAAVNAMSVLVFGALYAAAAVRALPEGAFPLALVAAFGAAAALWLRAERARPRGRDPIARVGRIAAALLLAVVAIPVGALMPLFALQTQLPPEAQLDSLIARVMVLLLAAVTLTALVNVAGACVVVARAVADRWRAFRGPGDRSGR